MNGMQELRWKRAVATGSLLTAAALLLSGRRKAALVATGVGAMALLAEDPDSVRRIWNHAPRYLQDGHAILDRLEEVRSSLETQKQQARHILSRS